MRGKHYRRAAVGQLTQNILNQPRRFRVEADGRFIKHQYFGIVHQGGGQRGLLLHAVAVRVECLIGGIGQVEHAQQLVNAVCHQLAIHVVQIADKAQQFAPGQFGVKIGRIGHIAAGGFGKQRLSLDIVPGHFDRARSRFQQPDNHLDRGGFARSVGPEEAENFPGAHFKADVVDGHEFAVFFDEVVGFDQGFRHEDGSRGGKDIALYAINVKTAQPIIV